MSTHEKLSAASNDRKSRLAQLKSLKRKQPTDSSPSDTPSTQEASDATTLTAPTTSTYLSGRNFDPTTRTLKLGYNLPPISDATATLEYKAAQLALDTKTQQDAEKREANKGLDLFRLQPKRPNWDLKRDLMGKMGGLDAVTASAIAGVVRERVGAQRRVGGGQGEGEEVGMEGSELVEAMHFKEEEEERERRREVEDEEAS
ncbi:hypothetical protein P153DRAFT_406241 [Dothidotthia symphoricarpi CBS 119687]|uniref:Cwf18 pre-mRNA splicing factor n=1 Tax=Dothidotthia symphoricarpi CBS 119687 TaxID=1392245 RepID=A0A6A6A8T3_9PLEO|nr:uncharacterized protein P153DRAFT_406241 [Dothidotthia symphoricarpi CBS 119687]KAF2127061.1 hypothetical protein P153DRAFT_406241 [Dothidotthia symphoricarpi CBS 119687]